MLRKKSSNGQKSERSVETGGKVPVNIPFIGLIKVFYGDGRGVQDNVFVDNTVKVFLIASAKKTNQSNNSIIEIYNIASDMNFTTEFQVMEVQRLFTENPPESYIGTIDAQLTKHSFTFYLATMIYHILPAIILDSIFLFTGKKPRLVKIYRKLFIANLAVYPFICRKFNFRTENYVGLEDYVLQIDKKGLSLIDSRIPLNSPETSKAMAMCLRGMKKYLLNEKPYATEAEIKRYKRMMILHKMFTLAAKGYIVYIVIKKLLIPFLTSQLDEIIRGQL